MTSIKTTYGACSMVLYICPAQKNFPSLSWYELLQVKLSPPSSRQSAGHCSSFVKGQWQKGDFEVSLECTALGHAEGDWIKRLGRADFRSIE